MESQMSPKTRQTILLVGKDKALSYLLGRFVEQSQCASTALPGVTSAREIADVNPKAIIFLSMKELEATQALMTELTSLETLIIVCSAVSDEVRAGELGADSCLLHPITYDSFQNALEVSSAPKRS
jgi:DNA-binding response OmpR family regulator